MTSLAYTLSGPKTYVIHDRPDEKLPIRRLQTEGAEVLSVNELLNIALGRVDGLEEIVREYGSSFLTTLHSVSEVVDSLHLDHIQATKLLAILALGRRLYEAPQGSLVQLRNSDDVYRHCRAMANLAKEQLKVLLINSRYQLVHEELLSVGSTDALTVSARDVFQPAVERRVSAVILVHNHPSDDPAPSPSDFEFTDKMVSAAALLGIELVDHLIIGRQSYQSCLRS